LIIQDHSLFKKDNGMKALHFILLFLLIAFSVCDLTMADSQMYDDQITVVIGAAIQDDPEKVKALHDNQVLELLRHYLETHIRRRGGVRPSLKVQVSITEFLLVWGKDSMSIEVQVYENSQKLIRFNFRRSTVRTPPVQRLTKALAKQTYNQLKKL